MSYPDLYIARHGQTEWNLQKRMQGGLDSPLTPLGKEQGQQLNAILRTIPKATAYISSPQLRAVHTAVLALDGIAPEISTDRRLREIGVGDWQGRSTLDLKASVQDKPLTHMLHYYDYAPGGETFAGLRIRCADFLSTLTGPTVVITHGITSRMLRLIALGQSDAQLSDLPGGQGIVHHIKDGVQKTLN